MDYIVKTNENTSKNATEEECINVGDVAGNFTFPYNTTNNRHDVAFNKTDTRPNVVEKPECSTPSDNALFPESSQSCGKRSLVLDSSADSKHQVNGMFNPSLEQEENAFTLPLIYEVEPSFDNDDEDLLQENAGVHDLDVGLGREENFLTVATANIPLEMRVFIRTSVISTSATFQVDLTVDNLTFACTLTSKYRKPHHKESLVKGYFILPTLNNHSNLETKYGFKTRFQLPTAEELKQMKATEVVQKSVNKKKRKKDDIKLEVTDGPRKMAKPTIPYPDITLQPLDAIHLERLFAFPLTNVLHADTGLQRYNESLLAKVYQYYLYRGKSKINGLSHTTLGFPKEIAPDLLSYWTLNNEKIDYKHTLDPNNLAPVIYSNEQIEFATRATKFFNGREKFDLIRLEGRAGTGKTFSLGLLLQKIPSVEIIYSTIKGQLVYNFLKEFPGLHGAVVCQIWICLFSLNYYQYLKVFHRISKMSLDNIKKVVDHLDMSLVNFPKFLMRSRVNMKSTKILMYIDEYSLLPPSEIYFLSLVLKRCAIKYGIQLCLVFTGDYNQIPPIVNIFPKYLETIDKILPNVVSFKTQQRNKDVMFQHLLNSISYDSNWIHLVQSHFATRYDPSTLVIDYEFPIEIYQDYPGVKFGDNTNMDTFYEMAFDVGRQMDEVTYMNPLAWTNRRFLNMSEVLAWWTKWKSVITRRDFIILTKSNYNLCLYNWSLAVKILNQIPSDKVTEVATVYQYDFKISKDDIIQLNEFKMATMNALIIGAPYLLLQTFSTYRKGELFWLLGIDRGMEQVLLIDENDQMLLLSPRAFEHNLYNSMSQLTLEGILKRRLGEAATVKCYGFPLQLAYAQTIFSSQGMTYEKHVKIYTDLNRCTKNETYVALSRAKQMSQIITNL